jgi:hypothetical protein
MIIDSRATQEEPGDAVPLKGDIMRSAREVNG